MKKFIYLILFPITLFLFMVSDCYSQEMPKPPQPSHPMPMHVGFDVIIKKNGELIYGLVKEVGLDLIKYQRTDIPDGPIYTIPRNEVYAISYRNQVKDILSPNTFRPPVDTIHVDTLLRDTLVTLPYKRKFSLGNGNFLVGIGIIRGFTKVDNADNYSSSTAFPVLSFAYEVWRQKNLNIGIQVAAGSHKFTNQEYSAYDSATKDVTLKENIFTVHLYGKYFLGSSTGNLQPYLTGGIGIQSSYVKSEYMLQFINNTNQTVSVKSGARAVGLGILLRAGAYYRFTDQVNAFIDAGTGPSVIQVGVALKLDQF